MHYHCLIVDDETELAKMTCEYFQMFDVSCTYVENITQCEQFLTEHTVEMLLLDINLKEESGFLLCKKIRETSDIPILFISARQSDDDVLAALNIGGDDYIKKPYSLSVLLAKVKIILKRMGKADAPREVESTSGKEGVKSYGKMTIDRNRMTVVLDGKEIMLKAREFQLLECLFDNRNKIMAKEKLFEEVWGDAFFSDGTLNVHIRKLREKLEKNPNEPKMITTVWGTGYLLKL